VAVFFGVPKISAIHGPVSGGNAGRSRPEAEETAKALAVPSLFSAVPAGWIRLSESSLGT
jgi:hypothetical protein